MSRKPLISGNWKMNLNHFEAIQTVQKLHVSASRRRSSMTVDVSVHPPFTDIRSRPDGHRGRRAVEVLLGAQHCHWEAERSIHRRGRRRRSSRNST